MYEVFFNEKKIVITHSGNTTFVKEEIITENLRTVEEVKKWFHDFTYSETRLAVILHPSPEVFRNDYFMRAFKPIQAAGGVVIRKNKILFILRNEKWDLPKGKTDRGETTGQAALREVAEECGITGHEITRQLPSTFHIYKSPYKELHGEWILKETHWFEMSYQGESDGQPEAGENITEIRWFAKNELGEVLENTYENLKSLISVFKK